MRSLMKIIDWVDLRRKATGVRPAKRSTKRVGCRRSIREGHGDDGDGGVGQAGAVVLSRWSRTQPAVSVLSVLAGPATGW